MFLIIPIIRVPPSPRSPEVGKKTALVCIAVNMLYFVISLSLSAVVMTLPMKLQNSYNDESYDWLGIAFLVTAVVSTGVSLFGDSLMLSTISEERPNLKRILGAHYCKRIGIIFVAPMIIFMAILRTQYQNSILDSASQYSSSHISSTYFTPPTLAPFDYNMKDLLDGVDYSLDQHHWSGTNDRESRSISFHQQTGKPIHITQSECSNNSACRAVMPMCAITAIVLFCKLICDVISYRFYLGCRLYLHRAEIEATQLAWQERAAATSEYNLNAGIVMTPGSAGIGHPQVLIQQPGGSYAVAPQFTAWTPPPPPPEELPPYSPPASHGAQETSAPIKSGSSVTDHPKGPPPEYKERE